MLVSLTSRSSEIHGQGVSSAVRSLPVDTMLAGISDSLSSNGNQDFSYQPPESFHTSSFSSASQVSPITVLTDGPFSQQGALPPNQSRSSLPTDDCMMLSSDSHSITPLKRQRFSPPVTASASQAAQSSTRDCDTVVPLQLSNGPQTKSEQQREVLEKLSKVVRTLGNSQQQDDNDRNSLSAFSDDEWVNVSKVLAGLLKERSKSMRPQQRRTTQGSSSSVQYCDFGDCNFSGRPCDLKKHSKRHQKPYGCTYPKCHKRFGAKSDWKRHENSQHYQLEAFRCDYLNSAGRKCGYHCCRPIQFQKHLAEKHKVSSIGQIQTSIKRCRIGKNCQGQYWCGFCREIKVLESKRNEAWDERFNHIAFHFEKEKISIDEWLCVEENRTKKELHEEVDRDDFTDATPLGTDVAMNDDNNEPSVDLDWSSVAEETTQDCSGTHSTAKDQQPSQPSIEKPQPALVWYCVSCIIHLDLTLLTSQCACKDGPATYSLQFGCTSCLHDICEHCPISNRQT